MFVTDRQLCSLDAGGALQVYLGLYELRHTSENSRKAVALLTNVTTTTLANIIGGSGEFKPGQMKRMDLAIGQDFWFRWWNIHYEEEHQ
jgi:hypothetical protein